MRESNKFIMFLPLVSWEPIRAPEQPAEVQCLYKIFVLCLKSIRWRGLIPKYLLFHFKRKSLPDFCRTSTRLLCKKKEFYVFLTILLSASFVVQLNLRQILISSVKLEPCDEFLILTFLGPTNSLNRYNVPSHPPALRNPNWEWCKRINKS